MPEPERTCGNCGKWRFRYADQYNREPVEEYGECLDFDGEETEAGDECVFVVSRWIPREEDDDAGQ